jgi:preprotein translocase subunit SecF
MALLIENPEQYHGKIDIFKHRWLYLGISLVLLIPGLVFMALSIMNYPTHSPLRLGIDFVGGTMLEYVFEKRLTQNDLPVIRTIFEQNGLPGAVIQIQEPHEGMQSLRGAEQTGQDEAKAPVEASAPAEKTTPSQDTQTSAAPPASARKETAAAAAATAAATQTQGPGSVASIRVKELKGQDLRPVQDALRNRYGALTLLQKNSIGPTLAAELFQKGLLALICAYLLIIGYLTYRFQLDYAVCAILALIHDTIFTLGVFSALGYLFHTEVDSMFITGLLTVVGFSVHDTIVVFDRLRENTRLYHTKKLPFSTIANISVNQTLRRSINTSVTALLTLLALYFFGGKTTQDFILVMILGIVAGTYSSIFNASVLLAMWRERKTSLAPAAA